MSEKTALKILEEIKLKAPTLSADGKNIILPGVDENYEVSLYGSSNHTVIALDGKVYSPLFDTQVSVMYRVTNKNDASDTAIDNFTEVALTIPGLYKKESGANEKPAVIPSLREWKGGKGEFSLKDSSKIFYKTQELKATAQKIAFYFEKMLGKALEISDTDGDIVLEISDKMELGKEGYYTEISEEKIVIGAPTVKGVLYGGTTITQILFDKSVVPCGIIRDYPQYPVRSQMIDLGRTFISLDYLREFVRYAAYFKINEIHMHINDNGGENNTAFRVESKKFPQINGTLREGEMFSQEDYKAYQKEAEEYGIEIMNEIDTPGHSAFLELYDKEISLRGMMDLTTDEKFEKSLKFIKGLFDEFLDGDDPVFRGSKFHIGNDEYWVDGMHEQQRKYLNELINYVNSKGRTPQYWAVLGGEEGSGVIGKTPVSNEAILCFWIDTATNPALMIEQGHKFVNCDVREALYLCPSNPYYGNQMRINAKWNYDNKDVNKVVGYEMPMASPLLLGYEPTFWNDCKSGISQLDVFESIKDAFLVTAEKAWQGKNTGEMTGKDFVKRIERLGNFAPGVNPARYFAPNENGVIASFDGTTDTSGNGHTMTLNGVEEITENGKKVLVFDGKSSIGLDMDEIGYGATISMDIYIDKNTPEDALLFSNDTTKIFLNYCGTGKIGYERQHYSYSFDYVLDTDRMHNIKITTSLRDDIHIEAGLCVDGVFVAKGYYEKEKLAHFNSSSLSLPVGKIGEGLIGKIGKIEIIGKNTTEQDANGDGSLNMEEIYNLLENSSNQRVKEILSVYDMAVKLEDTAVVNLLADRLAKIDDQDAVCNETKELVAILCEDIDRVDYAPESFAEYALAKLVAASVLCDFESDNVAFKYAVKRMNKAKENFVIAVPPIAKVTTNREQWKDHVVGNVLEESDEAFYWQNGPQVPGDYIKFEFSHPLELNSFTLVSCGDDRLLCAELQVLADGNEWKTVGDLSDMGDERTLKFEPEKVTAARILIKDHSSRWIKIKKVEFNGGKLTDTLYLEKELAREVAKTDYTAESYAEYEAKRTEAEAVLANTDKLQRDVSQALLNLKKARIALIKA